MDAETRRRQKPHVTGDDIKAGIMRLGLTKGDTLGVHTSLSSFGHVEGGADAVIDALLETVGPQGTIIVPTYSTNREPLERTEEEKRIGIRWKYKILPYDPATTPCSTGIVPETLRKRPGALRNPADTNSTTAIGARAQEFIDAWHDLTGWGKLLELDGLILLLGVGIGSCSALHLAERRVKLPKHILERVTIPKHLAEKYARERVGYQFGPYPDFAKMEEPCMRAGIVKSTMIGEARVRLVPLRPLVDLYTEELTKNPDAYYSG
ncbi:MAG: AAC(3) family N-acetyltransferase [Planctomycetia bacterium]|nr:AAC(3) family N-acetyltransferase [Planctomycetia bacterium]